MIKMEPNDPDEMPEFQYYCKFDCCNSRTPLGHMEITNHMVSHLKIIDKRAVVSTECSCGIVFLDRGSAELHAGRHTDRHKLTKVPEIDDIEAVKEATRQLNRLHARYIGIKKTHSAAVVHLPRGESETAYQASESVENSTSARVSEDVNGMATRRLDNKSTKRAQPRKIVNAQLRNNAREEVPHMQQNQPGAEENRPQEQQASPRPSRRNVDEPRRSRAPEAERIQKSRNASVPSLRESAAQSLMSASPVRLHTLLEAPLPEYSAISRPSTVQQTQKPRKPREQKRTTQEVHKEQSSQPRQIPLTRQHQVTAVHDTGAPSIRSPSPKRTRNDGSVTRVSTSTGPRVSRLPSSMTSEVYRNRSAASRESAEPRRAENHLNHDHSYGRSARSMTRKERPAQQRLQANSNGRSSSQHQRFPVPEVAARKQSYNETKKMALREQARVLEMVKQGTSSQTVRPPAVNSTNHMEPHLASRATVNDLGHGQGRTEGDRNDGQDTPVSGHTPLYDSDDDSFYNTSFTSRRSRSLSGPSTNHSRRTEYDGPARRTRSQLNLLEPVDYSERRDEKEFLRLWKDNMKPLERLRYEIEKEEFRRREKERESMEQESRDGEDWTESD